MLLNIQSKISKINKNLNKDLKEISSWLNANKIALNVAKTEVILFKAKHKPCDTALRLKDIINPLQLFVKICQFFCQNK